MTKQEAAKGQQLQRSGQPSQLAAPTAQDQVLLFHKQQNVAKVALSIQSRKRQLHRCRGKARCPWRFLALWLTWLCLPETSESQRPSCPAQPPLYTNCPARFVLHTLQTENVGL